MPDKAKLIAGGSTIIVGGGYLASSFAKSSFLGGIYVGSLCLVAYIGEKLLKDINHTKVLPELENDIRSIANKTIANTAVIATKAEKIGSFIENSIQKKIANN